MKCLFALLQLHIEYPQYFTANFNKLMKEHETSLIQQWLEIYDQTKIEIILKNLPLTMLGYESLNAFFESRISHIVSYYYLKEGENSPNISSLFRLWQTANNQNLSTLVTNYQMFASKFTPLLVQKLLQDNISLSNHSSLLNVEIIKRNFNHIFVELLLDFACEVRLEKFLDDLKIKPGSKALLSLFQSHEESYLNSSSNSIFRLVFKIDQNYYQYSNKEFILRNLQSKKYFLKNFIFNSNSKYYLNAVTKQMAQVHFIQYVVLKLVHCIQSCKTRLGKISDLKICDFVSSNRVYEVNEFNMKILRIVYDILVDLIEFINHMIIDMGNYDWSISCLVWTIFDYLNVSETVRTQLECVREFNTNLFNDLVTLIQNNSIKSNRFKWQLSFLSLVFESNSDKIILMSGLRSLIRPSHLKMKLNSLETDLKLCIYSIDLDRPESSKFTICYITLLLYIEFKNNSMSNLYLNKSSLKKVLRILMAKVLNLKNQKDSEYIELIGQCLSLMGPIDLDTYYLPVNKDLSKDCNEIQFSNSNQEWRFYLLKCFAENSSNCLNEFYYFLLENLIQLSIDQE